MHISRHLARKSFTIRKYYLSIFIQSDEKSDCAIDALYLISASLEYIANFTLMDDDFMKKVFTDKRCVQTVLRIILVKPDLAVTQVRTEYEVHNLYGRSVRLDINATDSSGTEFDIEIQRKDKGAGAKRARYNGSLIDADVLKKGEDFNDLPESFVIFITESDVLSGNKPIYHIDRIIRETGQEFKDGAHIVYVNNEIKDDTPLGRLMSDFSCKDAKNMYYKDLADRVGYYKENREGVESMCRDTFAFKVSLFCI